MLEKCPDLNGCHEEAAPEVANAAGLGASFDPQSREVQADGHTRRTQSGPKPRRQLNFPPDQQSVVFQLFTV
jgi:hypothetical protein